MITGHSKTVSQSPKLHIAQTGILVRLAVAGALFWFLINAVFIVTDFDWLRNSDSGWYWKVANNLQELDPAVTIGYPLIWRGLSELVSEIPPSIVGQSISFFAYIAMLLVAYEIFRFLGIQYAWAAAMLVGLFPLVGVVYSVMPRANSLLRLLTFLAILGYLKNKKFLFLFTVALLPLVHRSILPTIGLLVLLGLWEKKFSIWMVFVMGLPLTAYWIAGAIEHGDLLWYLTGYKNSESILGLPLADGLLGTLVNGFQGARNDLVQGVILLFYWLGAVFLFVSGIWRSQHILLALIIPVIFLGLIQPADEIWSLYNYTTYSVIPAVVFLHQKNYQWLQSRYIWIFVLLICLLSQFAFAIYTIHFLS